MVSVLLKSRHWNTLAAAAAADVSYVLGTSADFPDPAPDVPTGEDEIVGEDSSWDLRDLMSKEDGGPSAL